MLTSVSGRVTAMAGRARTSNGDRITFAVIVNCAGDPASGPRGMRRRPPAFLDVIADHPRRPSLDELGPVLVGSS
ncbi:MAG: hypothetical protein R2695_22270 [Acidimicrobiales bacterium]